MSFQAVIERGIAQNVTTAAAATSFLVQSYQQPGPRVAASSNNMNTPSSLFEICSELVSKTTTTSLDQYGVDFNSVQILQCVSQNLEAVTQRNNRNITTWFLVVCGAMVFFMQVGFAMLCAGCVRRKNVQNTMLKNLLDACGAAVAFYSVGYAFAFGGHTVVQGNTFVGTTQFFLTTFHNEETADVVDPAFFFWEYAFSATAVTIVAGTLAERCQMAAYLCYSLFLTGFVYPVVVHSIWSNNGFLSAFSLTPWIGRGCIDFAGSCVVHVTGGTTALISTYILGARKGRFTDSRGRKLAAPRNFPGHSIALQLMGTMVLWFGWYGFNCGSALLLPNSVETGIVGGTAAANTSLSASAGVISALFTNLYLKERETGEYNFDLTMAMNGALSGLVAITAGCATVECWAALLIGTVAGWIYIAGSKLLIYFQLDDAVDAIPVHMFNGAWGTIATGLFSSPRLTHMAFGYSDHVGWFYSLGSGTFDAILLGNQLLALVCTMLWAITTMLPFFVWLNYMGWFRADSLEELVGLDLSYHGSHAALDDEIKPDYIKAYNRKKIERKRKSGGGNARSAAGGGGSSCGGGEGKERGPFAEDVSWTDLTTGATPSSSDPRGATAITDAYSVGGSVKSGVSGVSAESELS